MNKYEDKIHQLELEVYSYENELRIAEQKCLSLLHEKAQVVEKLHLVLHHLAYNQALEAIRWANQIQNSGGILLPKSLQYPLPKEIAKEMQK